MARCRTYSSRTRCTSDSNISSDSTRRRPLALQAAKQRCSTCSCSRCATTSSCTSPSSTTRLLALPSASLSQTPLVSSASSSWRLDAAAAGGASGGSSSIAASSASRLPSPPGSTSIPAAPAPGPSSMAASRSLSRSSSRSSSAGAPPGAPSAGWASAFGVQVWRSSIVFCFLAGGPSRSPSRSSGTAGGAASCSGTWPRAALRSRPRSASRFLTCLAVRSLSSGNSATSSSANSEWSA
mmetsp:Transcript_11153/g.31149  ORF Transcript_11153/g.31149 Transcript_11153/m.31149 type:complete len:239 (-) Transcript_11153:164-880(-)